MLLYGAYSMMEKCGLERISKASVSFATKSIPEKGVYTGSVPSMEHREWTRNYSRLRHLDSMADRIKALEQQLASLQGNKED